MAPPPQPKKEDKPTIPKEKIPEILAAVEKHSNGGVSGHCLEEPSGLIADLIRTDSSLFSQHIKMNDLADKLDLRSDVYIKYINDLVRHYVRIHLSSPLQLHLLANLYISLFDIFQGLLRYQTDQRTGNMYVISVGALEKKK